ncbi:YEN1 [Cyberlindnera jadinii]|uniref:YEN1 protein n=2 Tax=Cyberlindnera jadinii (strain ATCC 18201 / CBS 1600 / BCRC 20928 / JCM 3617 / NBRC 0987 / NRRL Y-1542) TaxID=983966 RepID=A0A0H5C2Y8_CYBJN|nr:YEN1 [Cyberlindnera jadinii]
MGVQAIWDLIEDAVEERVPFSCFATRFYDTNKRPVRVAVDGYMWLVEASASIPPNVSKQAVMGKILQVFHTKIRYLISLNVTFVIVFDGPFKPSFKKKKLSGKQIQRLDVKNYDVQYEELQRSLGTRPITDLPEVRVIKEMLKLWNVSFVQAPADGEAECAKLQRAGVVDYVMSNDSDALAYGAGKMLKNFARHREDKPASTAGTQYFKKTQDWWVTPIHMETVERVKGYDSKRLRLLSILCGGDYNTGVSKLGPQKASQLVLCGTTLVTRHSSEFPYDTLPDFAQSLDEVYRPTSTLPKNEKLTKYIALQDSMFALVKSHPAPLFGRNEQHLTVGVDKFAGWPPDFVVSLYYRPLVHPDLFTFEDGVTNNGECTDPDAIFSLPKFKELYKLLGSYPHDNISDIAKWYYNSMTESYLLKYLICFMKGQWRDDSTLSFKKVREASYGPNESHSLFVLSVKLLRHGLHFFKMDGLYIDVDHAAPTYAIIVDLLPHDLANDLYRLETDRANEVELRRSPKRSHPSPVKVNPSRNLKRSHSELSSGNLTKKPDLKHTSTDIRAILGGSISPSRRGKFRMPIFGQGPSSSKNRSTVSSSPRKRTRTLPGVLSQVTTTRSPIEDNDIIEISSSTPSPQRTLQELKKRDVIPAVESSSTEVFEPAKQAHMSKVTEALITESELNQSVITISEHSIEAITDDSSLIELSHL